MDHNKKFGLVLEIARQNGLKFNKQKCKFSQSSIKYLGHILTNTGVEIDHDKVSAIQQMPKPKNKKEIEIFLGMCTYFSKFIKNYSVINEPLRNLIKKSVGFQWNAEQEQAFKDLIDCLITAPVLAYFNVKEKITISCDASQSGCGSVLLQNNKPIAYTSKAFTETVKNYAQIEKEMYAIVHACEKFHQYIFGRSDIIIETDYKPLIYIFKKSIAHAPACLQRMFNHTLLW